MSSIDAFLSDSGTMWRRDSGGEERSDRAVSHWYTGVPQVSRVRIRALLEDFSFSEW